VISLPTPRILDIGSWPEGANPWDGADVEVIAIPEDMLLGSARRKDVTLYETAYPGCTSLYEPDPEVIDRFSQISTDYNFKVVKEHKVLTHRLDALYLTADLIKLDVQGSELEVLRGGRATLSDAVAVQVEVEFLPLYKGQPTAGAVFAFMEERGFFLHQLRDCGGSPFKPFETAVAYLPAGQLLYADAVFIRWDLNDEQKLRLISVLWRVYRSYDLAIHLMLELDQDTAAVMLNQVQNIPSTAITMKAQ
jgi:hypothetical protein